MDSTTYPKIVNRATGEVMLPPAGVPAKFFAYKIDRRDVVKMPGGGFNHRKAIDNEGYLPSGIDRIAGFSARVPGCDDWYIPYLVYADLMKDGCEYCGASSHVYREDGKILAVLNGQRTLMLTPQGYRIQDEIGVVFLVKETA